MGRPQQKACKKQPDREKISGLGDSCPVGQITYPKSIEEFLSMNFHDDGAFRESFGMFLRKYKDESNQIGPNKLKHEQRLDFAILIANAVLDDKESEPTLAKIGKNFSRQADPKFKWVVDLLEGFDEAETLISHLRDFLNKDETVLDQLSFIHSIDEDNFQAYARRNLIGSIVTTRYNDRRHTIHDIDFVSTPSSVDHFKRKYNIDIKNPNQPLLVCMEKHEEEDEDEVTCRILPEVSFMAEAMTAELRVKKNFKVVVSAYRWVMEQLDLDLAEFKVFSEGLDRKERERWDMSVDKLREAKERNELADTDVVKLGKIQKKIQKDMEDIVGRYKNQNIENCRKNIDVVVNNIEGKPQGAVPKNKNNEKGLTRNKKRNNPNGKSKDGNNNANDKSLIKEKDMPNDVKAQVDETKSLLKEESLKNSQRNFKLTSSHQTNDRLREEQLNNPQFNFKLTSANKESYLSPSTTRITWTSTGDFSSSAAKLKTSSTSTPLALQYQNESLMLELQKIKDHMSKMKNEPKKTTEALNKTMSQLKETEINLREVLSKNTQLISQLASLSRTSTGANHKTGTDHSGAKTYEQYDGLVSQLQKDHPSLSQEQALTYLMELRASNNGKLSGMMAMMRQDIFKKVASYIQRDRSNAASLIRRDSGFVDGARAVERTRSIVDGANAEDSECSICLEHMVASDSLYYLNPCRHRFHTECINRWLKSPGGAGSTCPMCRNYVVDEKKFPNLGRGARRF